MVFNVFKKGLLYGGPPYMAPFIDPNVVISLTQGVVAKSKSTRFVYHYPIKDFSIEPVGFIGLAIEKISYHLSLGHKVFVHCLGGCGRTCTVVSTYLVLFQDYRYVDTVNEYVGQRGCGLESLIQERFLEIIDYLKHVRRLSVEDIILLVKSVDKLDDLLERAYGQ